jgi:hypothetical protein
MIDRRKPKSIGHYSESPEIIDEPGMEGTFPAGDTEGAQHAAEASKVSA